MSYQQYNPYTAPDAITRYLRRCGEAALSSGNISRSLAQFRDITTFGVQQKILRAAFDNGHTHFDLANNTARPPAKRNAARAPERDWRPTAQADLHQSRLRMWKVPTATTVPANTSSPASTSHKRMNLDMSISSITTAPTTKRLSKRQWELYDIVKSGKALRRHFNYNPEQTKRAIRCMKEMGMHMLIHRRTTIC